MSRRQKGGLLSAVGMAAGWWLVYLTGGTFSAATHLMYIPIVLAANYFGVAGGALAGVIAAVLMGLTPINTMTGQLQSLLSIGFRTIGFLGVGALVGYIVTRLNRQQHEVQDVLLQSVTGMINAMDASHEHTAGHCLRVAEISTILGKELRLDERRLLALKTGALLHDIGKMAVPAELLDKPGHLTPEEYREVQEHALAGERILKGFDLARFPEIRDIVRHHHERLDGSGYPDGLEGRQISLMARIAAVADVYDALTSVRAYRAALSHVEAMAILHQEVADGRMDGRLVALLEQVAPRLPVPTDREYVLRPNRAVV